MTDRREEILVRLQAILEGVNGIFTTGRNVTGVSDNQVPAAIVFDGSEAADANAPARLDGRATTLITMRPEIYLRVDEKAEDVGPRLNAFRSAIIKAVVFDADLLDLVSANGRIAYDSLETGRSDGRNVVGEAVMTFAISYVLKPAGL